MNAQSTTSAVDVLGLSAKGASGVTVATGTMTVFNPSTVGMFVAIISLVVTLILGWEKHKINKLQIRELENRRRKDDKCEESIK